jgi:redox-sensitive bicupin YhaK (pirin superfamily)
LHAARLTAGGSVTLPDAPYVHLFAARGAVDLEGGGRLDAGDAVRMTSAGAARVTAIDGDAEVLVWEMDGTLR